MADAQEPSQGAHRGGSSASLVRPAACTVIDLAPFEGTAAPEGGEERDSTAWSTGVEGARAQLSSRGYLVVCPAAGHAAAAAQPPASALVPAAQAADLVLASGVGSACPFARTAESTFNAMDCFFGAVASDAAVASAATSARAGATRGYSAPGTENFGSLVAAERALNDHVAKFRAGPLPLSGDGGGGGGGGGGEARAARPSDGHGHGQEQGTGQGKSTGKRRRYAETPWPPEAAVPGFRDAVCACHTAMEAVAQRCSRLLAAVCEMPELVDAITCRGSSSIVSLNRYVGRRRLAGKCSPSLLLAVATAKDEIVQ